MKKIVCVVGIIVALIVACKGMEPSHVVVLVGEYPNYQECTIHEPSTGWDTRDYYTGTLPDGSSCTVRGDVVLRKVMR